MINAQQAAPLKALRLTLIIYFFLDLDGSPLYDWPVLEDPAVSGNY